MYREHFTRCSVVATFHNLTLQFFFECADTRTWHLRDVASFANISAHDLVAILVRSFLIRPSRIAEEYSDLEFLLKPLVMEKEDVVVERERLEFGKPLSNAADRAFDGANGYRIYALKEWCAALAVGDVEDDSRSAFPRDDEVALRIPDALSCVDIQGSFGDHAFAVESGFLPSAPVFSLAYLRSVRFDSSAIWRSDVPANERSGDSGQVFVVPLDTFGDMLGRLVVHEVRLDDFLERRMKRDRTTL